MTLPKRTGPGRLAAGLTTGLAAAAMLALTAGPAAAQKQGGTAVFIVQPEPPTLASYLSTSGPIGQVAAKIYEGLLEYDFNLNPKPGLAESFKVSADGLTVTFTLRDGVTWHDGEPFTSADVQFTIMEVLKKVHPRGPNTFREVTAVDTPDPMTAVFRLANPAPYMMRALSGYESPMVPKHLLAGTDIRENPLATNPIGTGPFRFVEWRKGQFARLDANTAYWKDGLPYLDRIVTRFIPDASTRAAAMEKGDVHHAGFGAIPNVDVVRLRKMDHIKVVTDGYSMINPMMLLEFNTRVAPFNDKRVRQAIAQALDVDFIIKNIWFGFGKPATGAISSNFAGAGLYYPDTRKYQTDLDAAAALLDAAGYPVRNGTRFSINHDIIPYGEEWRRLGEYIKQALGQLNIEVTLRYEDVPTWLKRIYTDYDFTMNSNFFYQLADPAIGVHRQYATSSIRKGTVFVNSSGYSNPATDLLMDQASKEPDAARRSAVYDGLQLILSEDIPVRTVFEMQFTTVLHSTFRNAVSSPLGPYGSFADAWIND